jgi:hypothetical protein
LTVTVGAQADVTLTVAGVGGYLHGQLGPIVGVDLNNTHASGELAEPVSTEGDLWIGGGVQALGQQLGVTCGLAAGCETQLPRGSVEQGPTSESAYRTSESRSSTKLGVAAIIGISVGVNTQAVADIAKRTWEKLRTIF